MASQDKIVRLMELQGDSKVYFAETDLDRIEPFYVEDILLTDYVIERISKIGYPDLDLFPKRAGRIFSHPMLCRILEKLIAKGAEFESQYMPRFQNRKSMLEKIPECAYLDFIDTLHGIFADNRINWGRIIGFISFVGSYCQACVEKGMIRIVCSLVEYAVKYMDQNLSAWIVHNGGWCAFDQALIKEEFHLKLKR